MAGFRVLCHMKQQKRPPTTAEHRRAAISGRPARRSSKNADIAAVAKWVDIDRMTPEEAATKWIEENEAVWSKWSS